jgi:AraC-like DNA-binding protein
MEVAHRILPRLAEILCLARRGAEGRAAAKIWSEIVDIHERRAIRSCGETAGEFNGMTTLHIKNMVCNRCVMVVEGLLRGLGIEPVSVTLGEAVLASEPDKTTLGKIGVALRAVGFELIDDRRSRLVEQVKNAIVELVHHSDTALKTNLSDYIAERTRHDYGYISGLFSEIENTTIEKYFIAQKIERVKELLVYGEMNLNEIADAAGYSSAAHLSAQFKKVTGVTPGHFRQIKEKKRKPLDEV